MVIGTSSELKRRFLISCLFILRDVSKTKANLSGRDVLMDIVFKFFLCRLMHPSLCQSPSTQLLFYFQDSFVASPCCFPNGRSITPGSAHEPANTIQ